MLLFLGEKYNHNIPLKVYQVLLFFQENIQFGVNVDVTTFSDGKRETHNPAGRAHAPVVWDFYQVNSNYYLTASVV